MSRANRKRKNKGGRPRIEGVEREPSGRITRPTRVETEKEARAVVLEARQRIFGASESDCAKEEFGSVLGRLFLAKAIKKHQYDAGSRWAEDYYRYCCLTGMPHPSGRAQDISRVKGRGSEAPDQRVQTAANRVMAIEGLLGKNDISGRPITSITKRVCILDDGQGMEYLHMRAHLIRGLDLLVEYYGIERQVAA